MCHVALKWTCSCPNCSLWVSLINITGKLLSRVQKINGLQFVLKAQISFLGCYYWTQAATEAYVSMSVVRQNCLIPRILHIQSKSINVLKKTNLQSVKMNGKKCFGKFIILIRYFVFMWDRKHQNSLTCNWFNLWVILKENGVHQQLRKKSQI